MKKRKLLSLVLAAALCLGLSVPSFAMEKSLWPDYYSLESEYAKVKQDVAFHYAFNETVTTYESDGYHLIDSGTTFTLTNLRDDAGYVFVYYEPYTMQNDSLVLWTDHVEDGGVQQDFRGEYVCYNNDWSLQYYLNSDGQWEKLEGIINVFNEAFYDPNFYASDMSGMLLYGGDSVTFSLPEDGTDTIYLLWVCYNNPETGDYKWQYSEFKNASAPTVAGFSDVYGDDYYAEAVAWAKENDITGGTTPTTFSPGATVTRAEAVTFLWRAAGEPDPVSMESPYIDVLDPDNYFYKAVLWAAEQGIAGGVGGGRFSLWGDVSYEQMLAMLCRAAGEDASGADWSAKALAWAEENGLTDGISFSALDDCPRCDVVYCLWKQMA